MAMATAPATQRKNVISAGIASTLGWAMDLYDLLLLLYVASTIGPLLVPSDSPTIQLTFVYSSFAVTLMMRPLGSALFGNFADRSGRKKAMLIAVTGVGISTALMGAVPTYAVAGIVAPILFVVLRLLQGIFVGGVVASTHTLGTETVAPQHRGLMSGIIAGGGAGLGAIAASVVFLIVSALFPGEAFGAWGWRIMFFTGLLTCGISFLVYRKTAESPLWKGAEASGEKTVAPLKTLFSKKYLPVFLMNVFLVSGGASLYYLTVGFFPTFFAKINGLANIPSSVALIIINVFVVIGAVLGGSLSDRIGRRNVFLWFGAPMIVLGPLCYFLLGSFGADQIGLIIAVASVMCVVVLACQAPVLIFLNERFPTTIRATGTSLSWNVGFAIAGMMPTIVTALSPEVADFTSRAAILVGIMSVVILVSSLLLGETKHLGLRASDDDAHEDAVTDDDASGTQEATAPTRA